MNFVEPKGWGQPKTSICDMMKQDKSIRTCS
jgi:hypothetical protein